MDDGVPHVVGDHHRRQMVFADNLIRHGKHLFRSLRVKGRGMLVQKEYLGLFQSCHQKRQCLALAAGKKAYLCGESLLQSEIEPLQCLVEHLPFILGDAPLKAPSLSASQGECHVLLDHHVGVGTLHGILEDTAEDCCPLVIGHVGEIYVISLNRTLIHLEDACNGVKHRGLTGTVTADDGDEVSVIEGQAEVIKCKLCVYCSLVEGL